jgi:hypothetical protein
MHFYTQLIMKQQEMVKKIPVHSLIDLITNSSTEIFVHSEDAVEPAKELLTELLRLQGSEKTCDEVFEISVKQSEEDIDNYLEYYLEGDDDALEELGLTDLDDLDWKEKDKRLKKVIKEIKEGKKPMPDIDDYNVQTFLVVKSKDPKYDHIVELLDKLLYSPEWYEHSSD